MVGLISVHFRRRIVAMVISDMPHHTTMSSQISIKIWIDIAGSSITKYYSFYLY